MPKKDDPHSPKNKKKVKKHNDDDSVFSSPPVDMAGSVSEPSCLYCKSVSLYGFGISVCIAYLLLE